MWLWRTWGYLISYGERCGGTRLIPSDRLEREGMFCPIVLVTVSLHFIVSISLIWLFSEKKKKTLSIFNIKLKILRIHFTITIGVESYASTIKNNPNYIYIYIYTSVGVQPNSEKINIDFVYEIVNFSSLNLVILKKKSKNTTKYHNIFIISSFSGSE